MFRVEYKGTLIGNSVIPGENKASGIVPAHSSTALQLSPDRWIIFFATLDMRGHDACKSILYQLRAERPDGDILKEGIVTLNRKDWDPLNRGDEFWKCHGTPVTFGVSKGKKHNGKILPNANRFVIKWYTYAHIEKDDKLINSASHDWPGKKDVFNKTLRVEWAQFKLNDDGKDIEFIQKPQPLVRIDCDSRNFSGLGFGFSMNHSLTPPVPLDDSLQEWGEYDTFTRRGEGVGGHNWVAPIKYKYNMKSGLYEWIETGRLISFPGLAIGESSICRINGIFISSFRVFNKLTSVWFKSSDIFKEPQIIKEMPGHNIPRHIYLCADNKIRLICNNVDVSPYHHKRNPLYSYEVTGDDFQHSKPTVVFDAKKEVDVFRTPFVDMAKLFPPCKGTQILAFRFIDRSQTIGYKAKFPSSIKEVEKSGIHYVKISYK